MVVHDDGLQAVVERAAPQRQALAHYAEAVAIVEGDNRVEAAPAVELHQGFQAVHAWGQRCCQAVHRGHGVHAADEQCQPLPGHGIGPHEVRRCLVRSSQGHQRLR